MIAAYSIFKVHHSHNQPASQPASQHSPTALTSDLCFQIIPSGVNQACSCPVSRRSHMMRLIPPRAPGGEDRDKVYRDTDDIYFTQISMQIHNSFQ